MKRTKGQPVLSLVAFNPAVPRRYAQSTSGQSDSTFSAALDSRSIPIASDSEHGLVPYATLRKWPTVVPQRAAKSSRLSTGSDFKKVFKSMTYYHHTVTNKATPIGVFTKRLSIGETGRMDVEQLKAIRRLNLARAIDIYLDGNRSEMARLYNPMEPKPQQISELITNPKRSFGEKVARKLEEAIGLQRGQLDIENSQLLLLPGRTHSSTTRFPEIMKNLSQEEQSMVIDFIAVLRNGKEKKTG